MPGRGSVLFPGGAELWDPDGGRKGVRLFQPGSRYGADPDLYDPRRGELFHALSEKTGGGRDFSADAFCCTHVCNAVATCLICSILNRNDA